MTTVFMVCAVVGSVIVVVQFIMTLAGMGHDFGGDFHDVGADLGGDVGGDTGAGNGDHVLATAEHGSHFFSVLSFRAVVSALAVFGLAGLAANAGGMPAAAAFTVALAGGAAALFAVAWAMRFLVGLRDDGTVHVERAVGHHGTVYLTVPGARAGHGKVFLNLQNRTVELQAVTSSDSLPTGSSVVVVGVVGPSLVEVEPLKAEEKTIHA